MTDWSRLMSCLLLNCILTEIQVGYTPVPVNKSFHYKINSHRNKIFFLL